MAKKSSKKKKATKATRVKNLALARVLTGEAKGISYRCVGNPSSRCCKISDRRARMKPGDVVALIAVNTNVEIKFSNGSPFESGDTKFTIAEGDFRIEVVKNVIGSPPIRFPYNDNCCAACRTGCAGPEVPPEMIVE